MTKAAGERSKKVQNIELLKLVAVSVLQGSEKIPVNTKQTIEGSKIGCAERDP